MKAQWLYDFQENHAIFSGEELHEFFQTELGDPAPSGYTNVSDVAANRFIGPLFEKIKHNSPSLIEVVKTAEREWSRIEITHNEKMP